MPAVAAHLLARTPEVMRLFASDPFPDRPPTLLRMRGYRLTFTDPATQRRTGRYWHKEPAGNHMPMLYLDETGQVREASLEIADTALRNQDYAAAFEVYEQQYQSGNFEAGYRLADMLLRGNGVPADPARAVAVYTELAQAGETLAEYHLGVSYESGRGVGVDYAQAAAWYRLAARHGSLPALFNLGAMYANDRIVPRDDREGLTLLLEASARAQDGIDPAAGFVLEHQPATAKRLMDRMAPADIARAGKQAADRAKTRIATAEPEQ